MCLLQEKGNTPLHVAAKAGQVSQAELLSVYGADPGALDSNGKTPIDYSRYIFPLIDRVHIFSVIHDISGYILFEQFVLLLFVCVCFFREAGHYDLADRLVEIQYELTDRLAFYLCGRKPGNQ